MFRYRVEELGESVVEENTVHSLIYDEELVKRFINTLPELTKDKAYLLMLTIRSRLAKQIYGIKVADIVLMHEIILHSDDWKDRLFRRIKRLAILGGYAEEVFRVKGYPVKPRMCAIMLVVNPADIRKGVADFVKEIMNDIVLSYRFDRVVKAKKLLFGCLHRRARGHFHTIDVDSKDREIFNELRDELSPYSVKWIIETPRGYHFVVDLKASGVDFFKHFVLKRLPELKRKYSNTIEYLKHPQEPVVGTFYGGFKVKLIELD